MCDQCIFISVEATFYKNELIKNFVILFVFFCAFEPIDSFFKPIGFFVLIWSFFGKKWIDLIWKRLGYIHF